MPSPPQSPPSRRSFELQTFAQLFLVTGLAIADPILQTFGNDPDAFVRAGVSGLPVGLWALGVVLLPPLVLWCIEIIITGIRPAARMPVHLVFIGVAVSLWSVRICRDTFGIRGTVAVLVAVGLGFAFAVAFRRWPAFRRGLIFACWLPVLTFVQFVADPSVRELISSSGEVVAGSDSLAPSDHPEDEGASTTTGTDDPEDVASRDAVFDEGPVPTDETQIEPLGVFDADTPIVFVVLDAFPTWALLDGEGQIDETLYPNFAELASSSTWYRNATTVAPNTQRAVPAILTGVLDDPATRRTFTASSYPNSLFTLLGGSYDMNVFEQVSRVCPVNICAPRANSGIDALLAETITQWRRAVDPNLAEGIDGAVAAEGRVEHFEEWLAAVRGGATLNYHHLLMPHDPWWYNEDVQQYDGPQTTEGHNAWVWRRDEGVELGKQRFILQVMAADRMLGDLMDRMKEEGIWDDSLLVLTGDHGTSFLNRLSQRALDNGNHAEILWQLMMVRTPGQTEGEVSDSQVRTIDLVPTVADVLGITVPWEVTGTSVLDPAHPQLETLQVMNDWYPNRFADENPMIEVDADLFNDVLELSALPVDTIRDEFAPYRMGEYGALVTQKAADLNTSATPVSGTVEDVGRWTNYDSTAGTLPLYVRATFDESELSQYAVAVNGTIALTGPTYDSETLWGVLPSDYFVDGKNTVEVYLVEGPADAPILHKIDAS